MALMVLKHGQGEESPEKPVNSADHQATPARGCFWVWAWKCAL